ncbi:hypothetical protein [Streptomyces caniscabiei]|uniref:hypothetical protein n=1 Tax=Streptomyces caniscabiei TaxID=2746961 RepID=UPI000A3CC0BD|nr:hypothetical protein [Streptomyces caniscabiei]
MTGHRRLVVGQKVFDRDRQAHGDVARIYPSPLVVRLRDAAGFQWIARTVDCEQRASKVAAASTPTLTPALAGRVPVDVAPTELRVGDHVLDGGPLVAVTDLRYRYGATRTMILSTGRLAVAERVVRVSRFPARCRRRVHPCTERVADSTP